jgi:hypothetical protein
MDGLVRSFVGGGLRDLTHPSYQAWSYSCLLEDFNTAVQEHAIAINPCAYLHNCSDGSGVLADRYQDYLEKAPVLLRQDTEELVGFLTRCLQQGDSGESIKRIRDGRAKPSRQLAEVFEQMVLGNSEFILIEEQKVVYERALQFARKLQPGKRTVLLVRGGPGTGKSVVAIHLMAAMLQKGLNIRYVSKNAAPRTVFKAKLTGQLRRTRFDNLFCGSGAFVDCSPGQYDALVVDEAHRLNRFSGLYGNQGENQAAGGCIVSGFVRLALLGVWAAWQELMHHHHPRLRRTGDEAGGQPAGLREDAAELAAPQWLDPVQLLPLGRGDR